MQNDVFSVFFSGSTGLLCLGVYLLTYVFRTIVEQFWGAKLKTNKLWNELALPLGPIFVGALLGLLAKKFPLPANIADSVMAKLMYGAVCGMASGWAYSRFRAFMRPAPDATTQTVGQ